MYYYGNRCPTIASFPAVIMCKLHGQPDSAQDPAGLDCLGGRSQHRSSLSCDTRMKNTRGHDGNRRCKPEWAARRQRMSMTKESSSVSYVWILLVSAAVTIETSIILPQGGPDVWNMQASVATEDTVASPSAVLTSISTVMASCVDGKSHEQNNSQEFIAWYHHIYGT